MRKAVAYLLRVQKLEHQIACLLPDPKMASAITELAAEAAGSTLAMLPSYLRDCRYLLMRGESAESVIEWLGKLSK